MPAHPIENLRTLALVGHAGVGKTSLIESMLSAAGAIAAPGSVERGNTVCDYDPLEKEHAHSLKVACTHFEHEGVRVHLLDTPGYPDFSGRAMAALDAVESVAIVVDAQRGVEMSTARMALLAQTRRLCRFVVVHRIDAEGVDLPARVEELRATFGAECLPLNLPADGAKRVIDCFFSPEGVATDFSSVADAHQALVEQVVEVDDALTERYLAGESIEAGELHDAFERALRDGHIVPVLFASSRSGVGVNELLDFVVRLAPSPLEGNPPLFERWPGGDASRADPFATSRRADDHVLAHVFKVEIDPYVGRIAIVRVHQGTIVPDTPLYVGEGRKAVRAGAPQLVQGHDLRPLAAAGPGEICALTKIEELAYDAVLHDAPDDATIHYRPLPLPHAVYGLAIRVKKRGDEQKLSEVLHRLCAEDPSLAVEHDPTTHEAVVRGLGEVHVSRVLERIRSQYKLEVDAHPPTVPYRETISGYAEGHHRHKKQSGGAGQFGEVFLRVEPLARGEGFRFVDEVKGGAIPGPFIPAVEKGVRQALAGGAVAGFPVQDVKVTVYDGKTHPVDGKEIAFITAGRKAFLDAASKARPVVLEPIVALELTIPADAIGAVSGELSARRGQVSGADSARAGMATMNARAPMAELADFQGRLKAITGGQGSYSLELLGYEEAPAPVQHKLHAAWRPQQEE
ncbi:MAG: elongation factor G [Burkholderiaceae bacterium]|nr:elongation factor G [Burkholderiaceae bacterium]